MLDHVLSEVKQFSSFNFCVLIRVEKLEWPSLEAYGQSPQYLQDFITFKGIVNLYFTKFAVICLSPSISPSNQHINGCFILTEIWYALPMVFFSIIRDSEQNDQISHFEVFGSKSMPKHMLIFIFV